MSFKPGPGMGGHCLPVDPFYLSWKAREYDSKTAFIELAGEINAEMPYFCAEKIAGRAQRGLQGGHAARASAILGVSYKAGVGDIRESPAIKIMQLLADRGAELVYHDPYVPELPGFGLRSRRSTRCSAPTSSRIADRAPRNSTPTWCSAEPTSWSTSAASRAAAPPAASCGSRGPDDMTITVLRELWRRRFVVGIGIAYALLVVVLMTYRVSFGIPPKIESRQYTAGIAASDVLVDSPNSQIVDVGGGSADVEGATIDLGGLSTRARLLANLMSSSPLKDRIARAAGIRADHLIVIAPTGDDLTPQPTGSSPSVKVKMGDRDATVLGLFVDETLPILTMRVQAPAPETAELLATSAVKELREYLKSVASADKVPDARQLVIEPLGPATSAPVVKGPRRLFAIVAGLFVIVLWCLATVFIPRFARTWRDAARAEAEEADAEQKKATSLATRRRRQTTKASASKAATKSASAKATTKSGAKSTRTTRTVADSEPPPAPHKQRRPSPAAQQSR